LLVDDDLGVRHSFEKMFGKEHRVETAENASVALERLAEARPDLVLMDIRMPGSSGMEALRRIKESHPGVPVVMMTAYGDTQTAIEAMKMGALDYLLKPVQREDVRQLLKKALRVKRVLTTAAAALMADQPFDDQDVLVGSSEGMLQVYKLIGRVAQRNVAVLIQGESGTGKELVARAIHENSHRRDRPFLVANCAALPEGLLETELFGYEKGAFTGAGEKGKPGSFEICDGGTFLLDEIGDMSLVTQAKVLRVLQSGEFQKVGGVESIKVDVRMLAATNKNLEEEIERGRFREDLFHRINVVSIVIPPLRERKEDIPDLLNHMINRFNRQFGLELEGYTRRFLDRLRTHEWPGNVRELENVVKKAMVVCQAKILSSDDCYLPERPTDEAAGSGVQEELSHAVRGMLERDVACSEHPFDEIVARVEKALIQKALEMSEGNQVKASGLLGIARTTLRKKIDDYGLAAG
jgi:DNA-binding NtrC family response regulator